MKDAGLEEAQAGIKIARRNINNLRNADGTNLMAESEEELKSLLMRVKEFKKLRSWHLVPSLHGNRWGKNGKSGRFSFLGLQNHCGR